jgi:hypothetical protein
MTGSAAGAVSNLYQTYSLILFLGFSTPMFLALVKKILYIAR